MHTFTVTTPALNAILAGLRLLLLYREDALTLPAGESDAIDDIAADGEAAPLDPDAIDQLCERLNEADAIGGECVDYHLYLRAYNGKLVRVVAVLPVGDDKQPGATDGPNAYMAANPGIGLLAINRGLAYLAAISDEGTKPEKLGSESETMPAPEAPAPTATVQLNVELDADFIDHVLCSVIEQGYPWFDWTDIETAPDASPGDNGYYRAAMATEYDPDEGVPMEGAEGVRVDGPAIAAAINRILRGEVDISSSIVAYITNGVAEKDACHIDVDAADCIVQVAVLGEIRYG